MKFHRTTILIFAFFLTGSFAKADSSQLTTDADIQLFKQIELSNSPYVRVILEREDEPCIMAETMWHNSISQHYTSGYCRSNDCSTIGRTSTYCD